MTEKKPKINNNLIKELLNIGDKKLKSLNLRSKVNLDKLILRRNSKSSQLSKITRDKIKIKDFENNTRNNVDSQINYQYNQDNKEPFSKEDLRLLNDQLIFKEEIKTLRENIYELRQKSKFLYDELERKNKQLSHLDSQKDQMSSEIINLNNDLNSYRIRVTDLLSTLDSLKEDKKNEKLTFEHKINLAEERIKMHFDQFIELKINYEVVKNQKDNYEELSNAFEYQLNKSMTLINKLFRVKKIKHTRIDFKSIELESLINKN